MMKFNKHKEGGATLSPCHLQEGRGLRGCIMVTAYTVVCLVGLNKLFECLMALLGITNVTWQLT